MGGGGNASGRNGRLSVSHGPAGSARLPPALLALRADAYDLQQRTRVLRRLRQRAATLGFSLVNRETGEILEPAIS